MHVKRLANTGDTIVEVMIVLAILGLAISISYATANRSLLNTRQAQENSEATEFTQAQVENLRALASASKTVDTAASIFQTKSYCIRDVNAASPVIVNNGSNCIFGTTGLYNIQIYSCDNILSPPKNTTPCNGIDPSDPNKLNTLVVQTTWDDVLGQGKDSVTLTYKAHAQ